ncbi:MAG: histidine kinase, partial [Gammaproteobacteria bacterium]|nr:histidine kinase [Gammaproteobacteria bacterium]
MDKAYVEADQERYLNERSMEISSRELTELNEKLASAQHIAKLGSWDYDKKHGVMTLSRELHNLFNPQSDSEKLIHDLPTFLQQIDAEDQDKLNSAIEQAFSQGEEYEMELRSAALEQERRW